MKERMKGLIVIDVCEGSALEALPHMEAFEMNRKVQFKTIEDAIKYNIASNMIRNKTSSRISTPTTLVERKSNKGTIFYVWRFNRMESKKYWLGWFKGINKAFLGCKCSKILMTSEKGRMDKEFIIA